MGPEVRSVIRFFWWGGWLGVVFHQDSPDLTQESLNDGGQVRLTYSNLPPISGIQELMERY